jgi:hypothetical protein
MTPNLSQYLGKSILVSIPALSEDVVCRAYTLVGIELQGLWLRSDELTERLLHEAMHSYSDAEPAVFVPYAQIAGILVATVAARNPECRQEGAVTRGKRPEEPKKSPNTDFPSKKKKQ